MVRFAVVAAVALARVQAAEFDVGTGAYNKAGLAGRVFGKFGKFENHCLAQWIADYFLGLKPNATVVELGAGIGNYARYMTTREFGWVDCSDGNAAIGEATRGLCKTRNLVEPQLDLRRGDFAYCLEVAEHIPAQFQATFLDNLDRANKEGIVLSWSNSQCADAKSKAPQQHVSCKTKEQVLELMHGRGYVHQPGAEAAVRNATAQCRQAPWLRETVMVFARRKHTKKHER